MKTRLVRIGNARGIRIPKVLLEQAGLEDEVEISARSDSLLVRSAKNARAGWAEAFQSTAAHDDDALLDDLPPDQTVWDQSEWQWQ